MIRLIIALSMVYCTAGRGPYDRVMLDPGYTQMEGASQRQAGWTVEKVS